jgi:hypothetical protein
MKLRVLAVTVLMLILAACSGGGDTGTTEAVDAGGQAEGATAEDGEAYEESVAGLDSTAGGGSRAAVGGDDATQDSDSDSAAPPAQEPLPDPAPALTGDRIIKEGTITIEVESDGFDQAFTRVVAAARRYQGDVVGSSTRTSDNGDTFGSVTVRVPVANFEDLIVGIGDVGTIRNRDIDSQDVTTEFTDLQSRLRHLRAQERFYLGLLDRAETVGDAISVQQQLDGIQSQIEQIQGRLNVLDDRTSYSTLTVELFEPGAGSALATPTDPEARPTLARYWDTARDAFVNVIGAMLVAGLFALPLLIVAGALWFGYRTLVRPARRPAKPAPTEEREPVGADH